MFTKVSVLIPTRHRIERLCTMLASYEATTNGEPNSELVFRIDDDDVETRQFLAGYRYRVVVGPRGRGYSDFVRFLNEAAAVAEGDVLMIGNDDMIFRTYRWPALILACANDYSDGLFDIGVSTYNETHYPFATVSRKATDAVGAFCDPRIFWSDIYWRDVMGQLGRCVMLPSVHIEHDWVGFAPDQVFNESDKHIERHDPTYWSVTHAVAVRDAVDKLSGLLHVEVSR